MATLGSLVVSLEANLAKFTGEMEKSAYIAEQNARRTQKAIDNITGSIKGLVAAAGVGLSIKELWGTFKEVTTAESNLLKMANRLNTTTEELSALGIMARKTGMDADAFNIAIERMQKNISNAELKVEAAAGAVDEFGEPLEKGAKTLDELGLRAEVLNRLPLPVYPPGSGGEVVYDQARRRGKSVLEAIGEACKYALEHGLMPKVGM